MYAGFTQEWPVVRDLWKERFDKAKQHAFNEDHVVQLLQAAWGLRDAQAVQDPELGPDRRRWIAGEHVVMAMPDEVNPLVAMQHLILTLKPAGVPLDPPERLMEAIKTNVILDKHGRSTKLSNVIDKAFLLNRESFKVSKFLDGSYWGSLASLQSACGEVRSLLGQHVCISFNPLDMLLASEKGDVSSCFDLVRGGRSQSILSFFKTSFTGMVFVSKNREFPFYKTGRAWLFKKPNTCTLGRLYGTIRYLPQALARHLVPDYVPTFYTKYPENRVSQAECIPNVWRHAVYYDLDVGFVSAPAGVDPYPVMDFPVPPCVGCSNTVADPHQGHLCKVCAEAYWCCVGECRQVFPKDRQNPALRVCPPCHQILKQREIEREARHKKACEEREAAERERIEKINAERRRMGQPDYHPNEDLVQQVRADRWYDTGLPTGTGLYVQNGTSTVITGGTQYVWTGTYNNVITITGTTAGYVTYTQL